jgi:small subunit ribosomal protein S25e
MSGKGGAKKKWNKGGAKKKEKQSWAALLQDADQAAEIEKNVPKARLITPAKLADRYKITLTLARQILKQFETEGKLVRLVSHHALHVYGRVATDEVQEAEAEAQEEAKAKGPKKGPQKSRKAKAAAAEAQDKPEDKSAA